MFRSRKSLYLLRQFFVDLSLDLISCAPPQTLWTFQFAPLKSLTFHFILGVLVPLFLVLAQTETR